MNWLAHTLLSKTHIDYQLGNVLADPLKGVNWSGATQWLADGMLMHKAIDKFTDGHEVLAASKTRMGGDGHLKGVVLDLLYDHFLSIEWQQYCAEELAQFLTRFNHEALQTIQDYPERPQSIVTRMVQTNLLGQYIEFDGFVAALQRIDSRLSSRLKAKETASQYLPVVEQNFAALQADFNEFFPQLIDYFQAHSLGSQFDHYLKKAI